MNTTLKINERGTLTLPKPLRKMLGVSDGGTLMYTFRDGDIILQPAATYPIEIYTDERIAEFQEAEDAIGDEMDKYFEERGLVYDPATRTVFEKNTLRVKTIREKTTPYMKRKKKA